MERARFAKNTRKVRVEPLLSRSFIAAAKGSVGSKQFRKFYCTVNGKKSEVLRDGNLSCAYHISSLLKTFSLVSDIQLTVHRTLDDMLSSGWQKTKKLRPGCVILWSAKPADTGRMKKDGKTYAGAVRHLGIYVGEKKAVHNDGGKKKVPILDRWNYRPIEMFLWHRKLDGKK